MMSPELSVINGAGNDPELGFINFHLNMLDMFVNPGF